MAAAAGVRRQNWQVRLSPEELELLEAVRATEAGSPIWIDSRADWLVRLAASEGERLLAERPAGPSRLRAALEALDRQQCADRWARGGRPPFVRSPRQTQGPAQDAVTPSTGGDA